MKRIVRTWLGNLRWPLLASILLGSALLSCAGCQPGKPEAPAPAASPSGASPAPADNAKIERELWNACYIQGAKAGYEHVVFSRLERQGRPLVRIEGLVRLTIRRFQDVTESEIRCASLETPDGQVVEFETHVVGGGMPLTTRGRVQGDRLEVQTTSHGKTVPASHPWRPEYGGFFAVEQSLARRPMQPGEQRDVRALVAGTDQVALVELSAKKFESVKLLGGNYELLRIDTVLKLPGGQRLTETIWADRTGEVLRRRSDAMGLEALRVPQAVAIEKLDSPGIDLGKDLLVPLDRPLMLPHQTKRIRYKLTLEGGDPAGTFVSGYSQQVRSLDPHTAEVTVYAVRPDGPSGNPSAPDDPPTAADRSSNNHIQSDNPKIVAMAAEAAGQEKDPWKAAVALETRTRKTITKRDYSQAFASAAEVVDSGQGDCTEHAVLLAALCRARGIPARVAVGLIYLEQEGKPCFAYHTWNEVYVGARWIPLDATLAQGGIGVAHLKTAHSSLAGASAFISFLPVANVAGRLKIQIEEVQ